MISSQFDEVLLIALGMRIFLSPAWVLILRLSMGLVRGTIRASLAHVQDWPLLVRTIFPNYLRYGSLGIVGRSYGRAHFLEGPRT